MSPPCPFSTQKKTEQNKNKHKRRKIYCSVHTKHIAYVQSLFSYPYAILRCQLDWSASKERIEVFANSLPQGQNYSRTLFCSRKQEELPTGRNARFLALVDLTFYNRL